jgi:type 1 glutamine amidotransferase
VKSALIVWGGLELHEPEAGAHVLREILEAEGFAVTVTPDYQALGNAGDYDLVMPQITGGELDRDTTLRFLAGIEAGTGLAGFHHGLSCTFPGNAFFRFAAVCTFASHPGNIIDYRVDPKSLHDPIMAGISSFPHRSEQYYLHVDPAADVLATTTFTGEHAGWKANVQMPVVLKSVFGKARVFYTALGHKPAELADPSIRTILTRGMLWAAR